MVKIEKGKKPEVVGSPTQGSWPELPMALRKTLWWGKTLWLGKTLWWGKTLRWEAERCVIHR